MAGPRDALTGLGRRVGTMPSLRAEDTSTVFDSELTADTSPGRYVHSHDGFGKDNHYPI